MIFRKREVLETKGWETVIISETERLILRPLTVEDAPFILELLNDPSWYRFIGDKGVLTMEEQDQFLDGLRRMATDDDFRNEIATFQQAEAARWGNLDGKAGERIIALFRQLVETRGAECSVFDLDDAQWVINAARMKLSKEAKADPMRSHIVPLSQQAVFILRGLQQLTGAGRFVFPGARSDGKPMSENAITAALRRMGYDGDTMSWHGFRSMASTLLNEHGYNPDAIESQLAHVPGNKVRGAYNRAKYLPERRTMMQAWADYLDSLRTGANVIPIRRNSSG